MHITTHMPDAASLPMPITSPALPHHRLVTAHAGARIHSLIRIQRSLGRRLGRRHPGTGAAKGTPALLQCRSLPCGSPRTLLPRPSLRLLRLLRGLALRASSQQLKKYQAPAQLRAATMRVHQQLLRLPDLLHHLHLVCCHQSPIFHIMHAWLWCFLVP